MESKFILYGCCAIAVMFFAYMWFMLGANHHEKNIQSDIDSENDYVKSLEEEIEKLKCQLTSLHIHNAILDEELNGYQSRKDKSHD